MRRDRLPLAFILITLVIDAMGIGLIIPVMPTLIREVEGVGLAEAAVWGGILTSVFAVFQFLCAPTIGNLSDSYGRRPVLFVSLFVLTLDYLVMAVAGSIWLLLAGRVVGGIASATQSVGHAFIADISDANEKAARFGLAGAAFGVGFVLGPLVGGFLGEFGSRAPFYAAAALAATNLIFGYFVLPETVTDTIRRPFDWKRANPVGAFRAVATLPGIGWLVVMFFIYQVAFTVYPVIWSYFTQARFDWSPGMIGASLASFGVAMVFVQGVLIRPLINWLGTQNTVWWGLGFNALAFLAIGLVNNGILLMVLTPLTALGAVVVPAIQGMMSRVVSDQAQGELQGVLTSAASLAMIVSPMIMTWIFFRFSAEDAPFYNPGAPFFASMVLMGVCGLIFGYALKQNRS